MASLKKLPTHKSSQSGITNFFVKSSSPSSTGYWLAMMNWPGCSAFQIAGVPASMNGVYGGFSPMPSQEGNHLDPAFSVFRPIPGGTARHTFTSMIPTKLGSVECRSKCSNSSNWNSIDHTSIGKLVDRASISFQRGVQIASAWILCDPMGREESIDLS